MFSQRKETTSLDRLRQMLMENIRQQKAASVSVSKPARSLKEPTLARDMDEELPEQIIQDLAKEVGSVTPIQASSAYAAHQTKPVQPQAIQHDAVAHGQATAKQSSKLKNIAYSETKVMKSCAQHLANVHGIVKMDRSPLSEAFKLLRVQIVQKMKKQGWNSLAIISPGPGVGKTITATNLALCLAAELDKTVLLVDADLTKSGIQSVFGIEDMPGLSDYLLDSKPLNGLFINPGINRLVLLPSGKPVMNSAELLATDATEELIQELKTRYRDRFIIFDLPPLLTTADTLSFLPKVDCVLVVVAEGETTKQELENAAELLAPFNVIGTIMNKSTVQHG
ncbi:CpsD/CapB family tyrosine-protein kinase [Ampullimonas aquatilis]|uniref:CpsD/CapB family tyrosine-protein kinase n=1 Tax=Ampullimonas aquatilis TaxID=1341549 RepID=UPI003C7502F5